MTQTVSIVVAASLLAGCGSSAPPGIYLPTYGSMNALPTGLLEGTLVEEDGCLWIEPDDTRRLVLWPGGTSVANDGDQLVLQSAGEQVIVGTQVSSGGGEYGPGNYRFVVELIGEEVPSACQQTGLYWLAGSVTPAAP